MEWDPGERSTRRLFLIGAFAILALYFSLVGLGFSLQHQSVTWGGDAYQYVMHAQAIIEGRDYNDIPYIFNADNPRVGPESYPPGVPVFLTLPILAHGPDMQILKFYKLPLVAGILLLTVLLSRQYLPGWLALLPGFLLVLHPDLSGVRQFASEWLFMVLVLASFVLAERVLSVNSPFRIGGALALAFLISASTLTRTVGIVFFPAIALFSILRFRKIRMSTAGVVFVSALTGFVVVTFLVTNPLNDYVTMIERENDNLFGGIGSLVSQVFLNLKILPGVVSSTWKIAPKNVATVILSIPCFLLIGIGFLHGVFQKIRFPEVFLVGYISLLLISPFGLDARRFLPMIPLMMIYFVLGLKVSAEFAVARIERLDTSASLRLKTGVIALLAAPIVIMLLHSYVYVFSGQRDRDFEFGSPEDEHTRRMVSFIRDEVPATAALISSRPRTITALAGFVGSAPPRPLSEASTIQWMNRVSSSYLLLVNEDFEPPPTMLKIVHEEGYLKLYLLP